MTDSARTLTERQENLEESFRDLDSAFTAHTDAHHDFEDEAKKLNTEFRREVRAALEQQTDVLRKLTAGMNLLLIAHELEPLED